LNDHNLTLALAALGRNYGDAPAIVLKDPRVSLLAPLWDDVLKQAGYDPVYIIMVRHPLEVAESLRRRNNFAQSKTLMLWASYMVAAERDTRDLNRVFVDYDTLATRPLSILDRIEQQANVRMPRRTKLAANTIEQFVDVDLYHYRFNRNELTLRDDVWAVMADLYDWFATASTSASAPLSFEALDHAQRRMDDVFAAVGGVVAELRAQLAHVGALLANANHTCGVISSQAEQAQEAWNVERLALSAQLRDSHETAERTLDELRLAKSSLEDGEARFQMERLRLEALAADREAALEAERHRLEALLADRQTALESGEAERVRLADALDRLNNEIVGLNSEIVEKEASWREALQARDAALNASREELEAAQDVQADLEKTLALVRMHAEAGQAEHERLDALVSELEAKAQIASSEMRAQLKAMEQDVAKRLENALQQRRLERTALAELLASREQALDDLRSERDRLEDALNKASQAYKDIESQLQENLAAASIEASARIDLEQEVSAAKAHIESILQSRSWIVTKPLRAARRIAQLSRQ